MSLSQLRQVRRAMLLSLAQRCTRLRRSGMVLVSSGLITVYAGEAVLQTLGTGMTLTGMGILFASVRGWFDTEEQQLHLFVSVLRRLNYGEAELHQLQEEIESREERHISHAHQRSGDALVLWAIDILLEEHARNNQ